MNHMQIDQYKEIHKKHSGYGKGGNAHYYYIATIIYYQGYRGAIDFGCGKGGLADQLDRQSGFTCDRYDPAIPGIDVLPDKRTYDVVVNTDVLEHIPEAELDSVLHVFRKLSENAIIIPHLSRATRILPNGENAHCTIKTPSEWASLFRQYYSFVYQLPHLSIQHALFLCTERDLDINALDNMLKLYVSSKKESTYNHLPFAKRLEKAIHIVLGKEKLR